MPAPTVITSFPVGVPGGQATQVHVRDNTNGWDLYTLNADTQNVYPASCTKLMTLLLIQEYKGSVLNTETVTITSDDIAEPYAGITLSQAGFQAGDVCLWSDLILAILLPSSFEACQCAGRIIGNLIYANAGNTGDQGVMRFVEEMNNKATALGMTTAVYYDTFGGSYDGTTFRNKISPRDLSTVCTAVFAFSNMRTAAQTPTYSINITGANARSLAIAGYNAFINGPTNNRQGISDPNVQGGKNGTWQLNGISAFNYSGIWKTPGGQELVITTMFSPSLFCNMLDQRGIMYSCLRDFPYLAPDTVYDAHFANVQLLIGADGSIVDESSAARTLTVHNSSVGTAVIESSGAFTITDSSGYVSTPNDATLQVASQDMTMEIWYASATPPSGEYVFFGKCGADGTNREWVINDFGGDIQLFVSSDGANWNFTTGYNIGGNERAVFYNGAPRHLALVKNGSLWNLYLNGEVGANSLTIATAFSGNKAVAVGNVDAAGSGSIGNIDDARFTVGLARYSGFMFTPVSQKFGRSVSPPPPPPSIGQKHKYHSAYNIGGAYS